MFDPATGTLKVKGETFGGLRVEQGKEYRGPQSNLVPRNRSSNVAAAGGDGGPVTIIQNFYGPGGLSAAPQMKNAAQEMMQNLRYA